jgi:prepilin signal peptidase PulO-like enzyme (type II secretory pathway)
LIVTFWIDIDHMLILDIVTIPGAILGLIYSALITHQFWYSLAAVLYGLALLLAINSLTWLFIGRDGIGGGDFTLVAMLGAWLGLSGTLLGLGLAMVAGAAMGLVVMFARWLTQRHWQPFALALGVGLPVYVLGSVFMGMAAGQNQMPGLLVGLWLPDAMKLAIMGFAALIGASAGWLYMRTVKDEGYLEMPFGPALVLGGLLSLFWGAPLIEWYVGRLGPF